MSKRQKILQEEIQCPYLDTIQRARLDFDNEKVCSVTLSPINVYACLVCGKRYFQGRGQSSQAYFHSIDCDHHVFIHLENKNIFCLPDGYQVNDPTLHDIQYVLLPTYSDNEIKEIDMRDKTCLDLAKKKYFPGFVGLNNIKANDYINVVVQALAHVAPLRDYVLKQTFEKPLLLVAFSNIVRKMWNPKAYKGHVSPHELVAAIADASDKKYLSTKQSDPIKFLLWFLHALGTRKVKECFQGLIRVVTSVDDPESTNILPSDVQMPFQYLTLDLPPVPLYQDELEENIIPQVPIQDLIKKYDGETVQVKGGIRKTFSITKLPNYLIFHINRFLQNTFGSEKNSTIVNFLVEEIKVPYFDGVEMALVSYTLVANICHQGTDNTFKVHVKNANQWFQIQDLIVEEIMPQTLFLSEAYIQIWMKKE